MAQKGFLFEQQFCMGCQACMHACNARHGLEPGVYPRHADSFEIKLKAPYLSMACNHCNAPACVSVCPTGALSKRAEDGLVVHDAEVCIGCYSCVAACPYGAPQENALNQKMVKCDYCIGRMDKGEDPACVQACPMKVITIGDIEELEAQGGVKEGKDFTIESTDPNIRFVPFI